MKVYTNLSSKICFVFLLFFLTGYVSAQKRENPTNIDSLKSIITELKIQNLRMIESHQVLEQKFNNYTDMFKQQWTLFCWVTGFVIAVLGIVFPYYIRRNLSESQKLIDSKIDDINKLTRNVESEIKKFNLVEKNLKIDNNSNMSFTMASMAGVFLNMPSDGSEFEFRFNATGTYYLLEACWHAGECYLCEPNKSTFDELKLRLDDGDEWLEKAYRKSEVRDILLDDYLGRIDYSYILKLKVMKVNDEFDIPLKESLSNLQETLRLFNIKI